MVSCVSPGASEDDLIMLGIELVESDDEICLLDLPDASPTVDVADAEQGDPGVTSMQDGFRQAMLGVVSAQEERVSKLMDLFVARQHEQLVSNQVSFKCILQSQHALLKDAVHEFFDTRPSAKTVRKTTFAQDVDTSSKDRIPNTSAKLGSSHSCDSNGSSDGAHHDENTRIGTASVLERDPSEGTPPVWPIVVGRSTGRSRVISGVGAGGLPPGFAPQSVQMSAKPILSDITLTGTMNRQRIKEDFDARVSNMMRGGEVLPFLCLQCCDFGSRISRNIAKRRCHFTKAGCLVNSSIFQAVIYLSILANAAFIGYTSDLEVQEAFSAMRGESEALPRWVVASEFCFVMAFVSDVVLKILAHEGEFFVGDQWRWNWFDCIITFISVVELLLRGAVQ